MEKNMMLNVESANGMDMPNVKEVCGSLSAYIINKVKKPLYMLQGYYSYVLEKPVSMKQALLLLEAQGAFILTTFTDCSLPMRAVFASWFAWSVWRNGKEMKS